MSQRVCVAVLAGLVLACPADEEPTPGATESATTATATSAVASTTGEPQPPDCAAAVTQEDCTALADNPLGRPLCQWIDTYEVLDADTCELGDAQPECISLLYQGEGCLVASTCGMPDAGLPTIYYRDDGTLRLMAANLCETQPQAWSMCEWPAVDDTGGLGSTGASPEPPDPAACSCLCPG